MAQTFISYDRDDYALAVELAKELETHGMSVWWDSKLRGGSRYAKEILEQLNAAQAVLVIWSRHSVHSEFVESEARRALAAGKLVPLRTTDVEINDIPLGLDTRHTLPLNDLGGIIRAIKALAEQPPSKTSVPFNMYSFRAEEGHLSEGIRTILVREEHEISSSGRPAIAVGKLVKHGYALDEDRQLRPELDVHSPAPGHESDVVWADEADPPVLDGHGRFVAGDVRRTAEGHYKICGPKKGTGAIVRVDSGQFGNQDPAPIENHGSAPWDRVSDLLIAGTPIGPKVVPHRSALWWLPNGAVLLVKSSRPGGNFRLISTKVGLIAVPAAGLDKYFDKLATS